MAAPTFTAGVVGNVIPATSVASAMNAAAFLDLSTVIEGRVTVETTTGGVAPSVLTVWSFFEAYGTATPITLTAAASSGATSITVSSVAGLRVSQKIAIQQAAGSQLGELVTITNISSLTLTISGLTNGYSIGDGVYLVPSTPMFSLTPSSASNTFANNTAYSTTVCLETGQWIVACLNNDGVQAITATASVNKTQGFA